MFDKLSDRLGGEFDRLLGRGQVNGGELRETIPSGGGTCVGAGRVFAKQ